MLDVFIPVIASRFCQLHLLGEKMIKPGDRVFHTYDGRLIGTVIQLNEIASTVHLEGGTSARKLQAVVRLDTPRGDVDTFTADINDLMRE
jgi:hypothetical protein